MPKKLNNDRRNPGVRGVRPDNKKHKQAEAVERQAAYDALSVADKIDLLDRRLGVGVGAEKQRARLMKEMTNRMEKAPSIIASMPADVLKSDAGE